MLNSYYKIKTIKEMVDTEGVGIESFGERGFNTSGPNDGDDVFTDLMEDVMTENRIIFVEDDYWSIDDMWHIEEWMVAELIEDYEE